MDADLVVRVGDALSIRSAGGRGSDWYRHATQHDSGRIRAGGIETDVALQPVEDPALVAQVTEAYRAKYADQPSLVAMFLGAAGDRGDAARRPVVTKGIPS